MEPRADLFEDLRADDSDDIEVFGHKDPEVDPEELADQAEDNWLAEGRPKQKVRRVPGPNFPDDVKPFYGPIDGKMIPQRHPDYRTGRVNLGQYHRSVKKLFERAWLYFTFQLIVYSFFPPPERERQMAVVAWDESCESYNVDFGYDDFILQNVRIKFLPLFSIN